MATVRTVTQPSGGRGANCKADSPRCCYPHVPLLHPPPCSSPHAVWPSLQLRRLRNKRLWWAANSCYATSLVHCSTARMQRCLAAVRCCWYRPATAFLRTGRCSGRGRQPLSNPAAVHRRRRIPEQVQPDRRRRIRPALCGRRHAVCFPVRGWPRRWLPPSKPCGQHSGAQAQLVHLRL